ncbi:pectinesterase-like [Cornus florida]|uniref:pectinesterase-like n=1 Tax=Cornus florida TaxID=4283 RepID=UPI00289D035A|nr:pectinesterase-like [Cornus florida]
MGIQGILFFWLLGAAVLLRGSTISCAAMDPQENHVRTECGYTRYPALCVESLKELGSAHPQHVDFVSALVNKTISETKLSMSNFAKLSYHFITPEAQRTRLATDYCHKLMGMSTKRLNQALEALKQSPTKNKEDIQTWLSAALTFQQTCKDEAEADGLANELMSPILHQMDYVSQLGSNSLALVNRITSHKPDSSKNRRLLEEDDQVFPRWVSASDRKLLQATTIKANAVVAQDGTGNYKTVSEAIHAASGNRFVIYVKSGVYKEKINTGKDGITLIGDGKYSTTIVGDDSNAGGSSLRETATFTITGDGFIAKDIGFHNSAGPSGRQAVALCIASDHSVLYRCSIAGYQDTLYALSLRQFYRECDIYGTIDFIFGNAAAVFQSCSLLLRRPRSGGSYNAILASGRDDPGQNTGFSVQNCKIGASSDLSPVKHSFRSYLGRPWKQYSRSVIMQSNIDDAIASRGWVEWSGSSSLKSLYFAEYANVGPGAGTANRVQWPGYHVLGKPEAEKFTVANFISGTSWLPSTGVTFVAGL